MPTISEVLSSPASTPISALLNAGLEELSGDQEIVFVKYIRISLPLDDSVFWVRADLIGASALQNPSLVGPIPVSPTATLTAKGSLHKSTDQRQEETQTIGLTSLIFTSEVEVQALSEISPVIMWLGLFQGIRFSFATKNSYYAAADKHHYIGEALHPQLASQIIDNAGNINQRQVVSNSLPVWLSLRTTFPVYTSYLVPANVPPPYGVVHIDPRLTRAIQPVPYIDPRTGTHWQLAADVVKISLYGLRNDAAMDYYDMVLKYAAEAEIIGIMNMPVMRDEKRMQKELASLAICKTIEFEVSYYQTRINDVARQLILSCIPTYIIGD